MNLYFMIIDTLLGVGQDAIISESDKAEDIKEYIEKQGITLDDSRPCDLLMGVSKMNEAYGNDRYMLIISETE